MLRLPIIPNGDSPKVCQSHRYKSKTRETQKTKISPVKRTMKDLGLKTTKGPQLKSTKSVKLLNPYQKNVKEPVQECGASSSGASTAAFTNQSSQKESVGSMAAYSKASSEFGGGFTDAAVTTCFLKTSTSKFKKFQLALENDQINFYKYDTTEKSPTPRASHSLDDVHITTGAVE